jgi:hypothetical protein
VTIPTATYGEWLRAEALFVTTDSATLLANWGDDAPKSTRVTALASKAGADAESARQQTFMGQPMAREVHTVRGRFAPYIGKTVTMKGTRLGYDAGLDVIVLGAQDDLATGVSQVTVLRRLT